MIPVSLTDLRLAARLLSEAAAYTAAHATGAKMADKARQMIKLSKKLQKKIDNEKKKISTRRCAVLQSAQKRH